MPGHTLPETEGEGQIVLGNFPGLSQLSFQLEIVVVANQAIGDQAVDMALSRSG